MHWTRATLYTVLLAVIGPFLVEKLYPAYLLIRNHPRFLKNVNVFSEWKVEWEDEVRNCEDIVMDEKRGAVILSCDAGRDLWNTVMGTFIDPTEAVGVLYYHKYPKFGWNEKPQLHQLQMDGFNVSQWMNFHPLGLGYYPSTRTLYVVNHAQQGSTIEVFEVNKQVTGITYQRTITHPLLKTPNSVTPISAHEVYVTNDHKYEIKDHKEMATLETYLSIHGGSVVYMNFKTNVTKVVANLPFANGIALLNASTLAVASTTGPWVNIYNISPTTKDLKLNLKINVPFWVDNLKVDSRGVLLMAGHPWAPGVEKISKTNHLYAHSEARKEGLRPLEGRPRAPSWVAEWDGNKEGRIKDLYVGGEYGTSTAVVRDVERGVGFVVGLYEKGVMMFKV